ncbi:MAG TPA: hypothetical protein VFD92_22890 [Candidatus Binatia bacterium]|nr:hypothetical protein [Candidatus Binatia bacterium]
MLKVQGKSGTYPVSPADKPVRAIVTLRDESAATAGLCGESSFAAADCSFNPAGNSLKCQK